MLIQITGDEPSFIVDECGSNGLDAWRRLCARHGPYTKKRDLDRIDKLMDVSRARDYGRVAAPFELWERELRLYIDKTDVGSPETWRTNILMQLVLAEYAKHLRLRFIRGEHKYDDVRQTIMFFLRVSSGTGLHKWRSACWTAGLRILVH